MKKSSRMISAIMCLIFIVGCESEVKVAPENIAVESTTPLELATIQPSAMPSEIPAYVENSAQAVRIALEPRGFLKAPIKTVVADTPQTFIIEFREGMNRNSVEETLRKLAPIGGVSPSQLDLQFNWQNEKELHLTVSMSGLEEQIYPTDAYKIDVNGALTSSGKVLIDAPIFQTLIQKTKQVWRISVSDGRIEKVSTLGEPFNMQSLYSADYMLATQYLHYCECDMTLPLQSSIYNARLDQLTTYPVPLMINYKGKGEFVSDKRGFFYGQPQNGEVVPTSDTVENVHISGYVHGSSFSHDRKNLLLAVGQEKQESDLDFVVYNLETKRTVTLPKQLIGQVPDNQVSSAKIPIQFQDDGRYVYTYMVNEETHTIQEYRYTWSSGKLEAWKSPVGDDAWNGFLATDDGAYRYYYNGGMYSGSERIALPDDVYPYFWLKGTHNFVLLKVTDTSPNSSQTLYSYNVDDHNMQTIAKLPHGEYQFVGSSEDGRWVYVLSGNDL